MITITNYLFRQNRTGNITKVILITHIKKSITTISGKGDCTEDMMAASIQPPIHDYVHCKICLLYCQC